MAINRSNRPPTSRAGGFARFARAAGLALVPAWCGCASAAIQAAQSTSTQQPPPAIGATSPEEVAGTGAAARPTRQVTIRDPGPDLANFPNASYTLPEGGIYAEMSPVAFQGSSASSPRQYDWEILLRYGLTDAGELRLFTQGFTIQGRPQSATGFSPLTFDTKIHLAEGTWNYFNYSAGIEAYVQSTWGSEAFDAGTQFSLTLNADHTLPGDVALNWNVGFLRLEDALGENVYLPSFQWALQRAVVNDVAVFIQGYLNSASLPRESTSGSTVVDIRDQHVFGGGFQWTIGERIAFFGSYNRGMNQEAPDYLGTLGFAVAF